MNVQQLNGRLCGTNKTIENGNNKSLEILSRYKPFGFGIYRLLRRWFLKFYHYELSQRLTHKNLTPVMIDENGVKYYEFPESMALPVVRFLKNKEYIAWMGGGLDGDIVEQICSTAQECLIDALKQPPGSKPQTKALSKVNALLQQMSDRKSRVVPIDLVVNILCSQLIREDEDPVEWNEIIHAEKCDYFKAHINDYGFFLNFTAFRRLSKDMTVSEESWSEYLVKATAQIQALTQATMIFSRKG